MQVVQVAVTAVQYGSEGSRGAGLPPRPLVARRASQRVVRRPWVVRVVVQCLDRGWWVLEVLVAAGTVWVACRWQPSRWLLWGCCCS